MTDRIAASGTATAAAGAGAGELIGALVADLRASLAARFDIARIEARNSLGLGLRGVGAAGAAVLLALTAWWAVCAALTVLAVDWGASRITALLGVAALNALLALWGAVYARQRLRAIGMPHTRRVFLETHEGLSDDRPD